MPGERKGTFGRIGIVAEPRSGSRSNIKWDDMRRATWARRWKNAGRVNVGSGNLEVLHRTHTSRRRARKAPGQTVEK